MAPGPVSMPEMDRKPQGGSRIKTGKIVWNKSVMRFQGLLGFVVLAAVGLVAWSHFSGLIPEERPVRAKAEARELASAALDFHSDTGQWPRDSDGKIDLTPLLGGRSGRNAKSTTMAAGAMDGGLGGLSGAEAPRGNVVTGRFWLEEIPLDPWGQPYEVMQTDAAIAVLSTGPNRKLDTDPARLWTRPANINPCDGDDVGIVLEIDSQGGF
jgi:hypothetical protein